MGEKSSGIILWLVFLIGIALGQFSMVGAFWLEKHVEIRWVEAEIPSPETIQGTVESDDDAG